jgi:hypothetical protein
MAKMGCLLTTERRIIVDTRIDNYNGVLYQRLLGQNINSINIDETHGMAETINFTVSGKNINIDIDEGVWRYIDNDLIIVDCAYPIIIVRDKYGNGYLRKGHRTESINDLIAKCIELEDAVDTILINFSDIYKSKIYSSCKFGIINNFEYGNIKRVDKEPSWGWGSKQDIVYTDKSSTPIILIKDYGPPNYRDLININGINIHLDLIKIVHIILEKVMRHEYVEDVYAGIAISDVKRAK